MMVYLKDIPGNVYRNYANFAHKQGRQITEQLSIDFNVAVTYNRESGGHLYIDISEEDYAIFLLKYS